MTRIFRMLCFGAILLVAAPLAAQTPKPAPAPAPKQAPNPAPPAGSADRFKFPEKWQGVYRMTFAHSGSNPDSDLPFDLRGSMKWRATGAFMVENEAGWPTWSGKVSAHAETNHEYGYKFKASSWDGKRNPVEFKTTVYTITGRYSGSTDNDVHSAVLVIRDGFYRLSTQASCNSLGVEVDTLHGNYERQDYSLMDLEVNGAIPARPEDLLLQGLSGSMACPVVDSHNEDVYRPILGDRLAPNGVVAMHIGVGAWDGRKSPPVPPATVEWKIWPVPPTSGIAPKVTFRQPRDSAPGSEQWRPAEDFVDFLVGKLQPAIEVKIVTLPPEATVEWDLKPLGGHSGTVKPNTGTSKEFSFTPIMPKTPPRTPPAKKGGGLRKANDPVAYRLSVRTTSADWMGRTEGTIRQDTKSILRQEYVDYNKQPPDRAKVVDKPALPAGMRLDPNFSWGNYAPITLNDGWFDFAKKTQAALAQPIEINSAYRNPQRNRAANGAENSVHMMGGAVDMDPVPDNSPSTPEGLIQLYRKALEKSGAAKIYVERADPDYPGGIVLLPEHWQPPPAIHSFTVGGATVIVEDTNADDLPDRVKEVIYNNTPVNLPSRFPYNGHGVSNPDFVIFDSNGNNQVDAGDELLLNYIAIGIQNRFPGPYPALPLRSYFEQASHVHCDNGNKAKPLTHP